MIKRICPTKSVILREFGPQILCSQFSWFFLQWYFFRVKISYRYTLKDPKFVKIITIVRQILLQSSIMWDKFFWDHQFCETNYVTIINSVRQIFYWNFLILIRFGRFGGFQREVHNLQLILHHICLLSPPFNGPFKGVCTTKGNLQ